MKANAPDHVAVTGDLVNLALDQEIELARLWLETLGNPHDVSVVPGNHDAYVPGALDRVCRAWGPWMSGDDAKALGRPQVLPLSAHPRQRRADRRHIGARHRALHGQRLLPRETSRAGWARLLDATGKRGLFRVVMIHHPPVRNAVPQHKRLFGIDNFQSTIRRHGAELVLHGHSHLPSLHWIDGKTRARCRWSASPPPARRRAARKPAAQYNLIDISGEPGAWSRAADTARPDRPDDAARRDRGSRPLCGRARLEKIRS